MTILAFLLSLAVAAPPSPTEEALMKAATSLYEAAAYKEALDAFDAMRKAAQPESYASLDVFRASCLVGLNRFDDARVVLKQIVDEDPARAAIDAPPKLQEMFADVRAHALPELVDTTFEHGKQLLASKDTPAAIGEFDRVIELLRDPLFTADASRREYVADMTTLATNFRDLGKAMTTAPTHPAAAAAPHVYRASDKDVTPPVAVYRDLRVPPQIASTLPNDLSSTVLLITVTPQGSVENATVERPVNPAFDALVAQVARTWRFKPALRNNEPVRYAEAIRLNLR